MSLGSSIVEVQLEIGHRATPKHKKTPDGHTHDWTVFVRGIDSGNIHHFVEKVIFYLHESFPKPKRVVKEPPYQLNESGYASFELPVEVYFRNREEPKKIMFEYDLFIDLQKPVNKVVREKLTFQNPSADFKKKLLKGGGLKRESNSTATSGTTSCESPTNSSSQSVSKASCGITSLAVSASISSSKDTQPSSIITSRREKSSSSSSSSKQHQASASSSTTSQSSLSCTSLSTPPISSIKEVKSATLGSISRTQLASSGTPTINSSTTPVPDQFTDLFGPPIQTRPLSNESSAVSSSSINSSTCSSGNNSHSSKKGNQSKSKSAINSKSTAKSSTTSSLSGSKEAAFFSQHNELKSSSKASGAKVANAPSTTSTTTSNSARSVSQQCQVSTKAELASKHSKVFSSTSSSQQGNNRSSSGVSFGKESKEPSKDKLSFSASHDKKENVSVKMSKSSSRVDSNNKKSQDKKKSKSTKNADPPELSVLSPVDVSLVKDESIKKSKSKKESRDRSTTKAQSTKVKVEDDETLVSSKKLKTKSKDKEKGGKKDRKRKKKEVTSSDEFDKSELSDDDGDHNEHNIFMSKLKRRRHNSDSSSSSLVATNNDLIKTSSDEPSYLYHPQASASMSKGSMALETARVFSREQHPAISIAERTKQKLLAESVGSHFPALLHNSKLTQSPATIFAAASFSTSTSAHHSPSLASSPLSGSPSPSQKLISSKSQIHEDSNGSSNGGSSGGGISKKESASSSKKLSKMSKDMLNNSSGTETSQLMSTKIKYRDDKSVTTIEIKQINKEKTWDNSNEIKKHKSTKESSKSSSSSSNVLTSGSVKQSQGSSKANKSAMHGSDQANTNANSRHESSNMQESSKLSASNSSLSSAASSTTKKSKKSGSSSKEKKHSQEGDKEGCKKSSKKNKFAQEEPTKKKKKRDHSPSPSMEGKMPPPLTYPATHSKYNLALSSEPIYSDNSLVTKAQLGSKLDHRHRSESPALSVCSSSSEVSPYQPAPVSKSNKKHKTNTDEMYQQVKVGHVKGQQSHNHHLLHHHVQHRKGKLDHESDCDNNEDDEDDKMSTVSASSAVSVSSVSSHSSASSAMSISSSASSVSASSASSTDKNNSKSSKKTISKHYSKKDRHLTKSSVKHSNSVKEHHHSKSKVETKEEPFEYAGHKAHSKYEPEPETKASKTSKSKTAKPHLSSEDETSGSESDSDSGSDSDHHSAHHSDESEDEHHSSKLPNNHAKGNLNHSSDSESEDVDKRFVSAKNVSPNKALLLSSPPMTKKEASKAKTDSKRSRKVQLDESQSMEPKKVSKRNKLCPQPGQSLLAPLSEPVKSVSPVLAKNKFTSNSKNSQTRRCSPMKRTSGYTGLSDSDSSMDENEPQVSKQMERHSSPVVEETGDKNRKSLGKRPKIKKEPKESNLSSGSSSESSQSSESASSSDESEDEEHHASSLRSNANSHLSGQVSPQTTPNSRLPASNIYSKTNHHPPAHISSPFERLYQNNAYQSNERQSLSPPQQSSTLHSSGFTYVELRDIQYKIAQLADSEMLQQVVDLIEERNNRCFNIVNNCLQFDLLKLDQSTLVEIKRLVC